MVELEFHCCMCGEENRLKTFVDLNEFEQDVNVDCQYCKEKLNLTVISKHVVSMVDEQ